MVGEQLSELLDRVGTIHDATVRTV
jgi:hypothetical protein